MRASRQLCHSAAACLARCAEGGRRDFSSTARRSSSAARKRFTHEVHSLLRVSRFAGHHQAVCDVAVQAAKSGKDVGVLMPEGCIMTS